MAYPTNLPTYTDPTSTNPLSDPDLATQQAAQNADIIALATKVGVDGSEEATSLDYILKNTTGGHDHDGTNSKSISVGYPAEGRLTLESGVPISTSDQSAKTTLYYTPYTGNRIALYDGSKWTTLTFTELSLSLSGYTANKNYDIFVYNNSGAAALESLAWTDDTTRATSLVLQNGVYVKSGATTRRYIGTIRINATGGQTEDTFKQRFVYNAYNTVRRSFAAYNTTSSWTYTTASWREFNNGTGQTRGEVVIGLVDHLLCQVSHYFRAINTHATTSAYLSVTADSTNGTIQIAAYATVDSAISQLQSAGAIRLSSVGYHYFTGIEYGATTLTNYGSASLPSETGSTATGSIRIVATL